LGGKINALRTGGWGHQIKMNKYLYLILGVVFLLTISVGGCKNPLYIYEEGEILVGGDGEPIELINNPSATNPTYAELIAFIQQDTTDTNDYLENPYIGYVCADFAEDVHNNAEAAGIRAASVSIQFKGSDKGHACNAFDTIDKGLVYIDCTGQSFSDKLNLRLVETEEGFSFVSEGPTSWDAIAYVEIGKEYGLIPLAKAKALSYSFYEEYKQLWQEYRELLDAFNDSVAQFNQEVEGKTYYEGSPELARIEAWKAELEKQNKLIDKLSEELGDVWLEPKGIVKDVYTHWGKE
jgi:hypothetical protein